MSWTSDRIGPSGSRWAVVAALAIFLTGINYCLVGVAASAFGDRAPACHAAPWRLPGDDSFCHPANPVAGHPTTPAPGSPPCCLAYIIVSGPQLDHLDGASIAAISDRPLSSPPVTAVWHGVPARDAQPPPIVLHRWPSRGRAPPLA